MPERFLLQILRNLVNHGILRSTRGVEGGYSLIKPADEISLLDLIEAIEGPLEYDQRQDPLAGSSQDLLTVAMQQVTATSRQQLAAIKMSQLLSPPEN